MNKDATVILRVEPYVKARALAHAKIRGISLSRFLYALILKGMRINKGEQHDKN